VRLGDALRAQGLPNEAVDAWHQGFETTGSPIFLTFLEEHFLAQEQPLAAIEALKRCVARARKDTLPRFYLGKLFFRLEMLDDALAILQSLDGRASYAPTLHYLLGRIHERRRNHRDAATEYRKVIKEMELVQLDYRCRACKQTGRSGPPDARIAVNGTRSKLISAKRYPWKISDSHLRLSTRRAFDLSPHLGSSGASSPADA